MDLLKPEVPAIPLLLLYLDRTLARKHLPGALGLTLQALVSTVGKLLLGTATLASGAGQNPDTASPLDDMAWALAQTYSDAQRRNPARCAGELLEWLESDPHPDESAREGTLAAHGGMRARMLRAFLTLASDRDRFFDRHHRSADDRRIIKAYLPQDTFPRVVITGHTHAARKIRVSADYTYLNTGTWTDLIAFPSIVDDVTLKTWIDQLEARTVPRTKRLTWAEVTPDRVALHEASA